VRLKSLSRASRLFLIYSDASISVSNRYGAEAMSSASEFEVEGEILVSALKSFREIVSNIWTAMCESQMRKAQMEIDRYNDRRRVRSASGRADSDPSRRSR
jgi:hypothetical protein